MKKKLILFGTIAILVGLLLIVLWLTTKKPKITKHSDFTDTELRWIESLSKKNQNYFFDHKELYGLIKHNNFQVSKFPEYIDFYQKYSNLSLHEIIMIVNHNLQNEEIETSKRALELMDEKHFEPSRLKRYLAYQKENSTLERNQIILLVNQDIDTIIMKYHDSIDGFLKEPYFIKENLERYIQYHEQHKIDFTTTVAYVNSNVDYDYYTNTQNSDLEKDHLMIVNKYYALPNDYIPSDLVSIEHKYGQLKIKKEAYEAFKKMADAAKKENLSLYIQSPYRSYQTQATLYQRYCDKDGKTIADTYSARPGHSEHQTGYAIDITNGAGQSLSSFESTKEFYWMKENAHHYGFILRYPKGKEKENITGYQYEPWHYRYVGVEVATKVKELDITFDEYYAYYIK